MIKNIRFMKIPVVRSRLTEIPVADPVGLLKYCQEYLKYEQITLFLEEINRETPGGIENADILLPFYQSELDPENKDTIHICLSCQWFLTPTRGCIYTRSCIFSAPKKFFGKRVIRPARG